MDKTMKGLAFSTIAEVGSMIRSGESTSSELTGLMLERISRLDESLNAFITVTLDQALQQAQHADRELSSGLDRGPLHGIPIAIKDIIFTRGTRTTAGTLVFKDRIPDSDAVVVTRLKDAGTVILGKTGMDELAWGSTSSNPYYGNVRNPWNREFHPGGSSGGSAAAVAAGLAFAALGTDTGCSVRQPAHCCGIVGFKPSYGLVSKAGVAPFVPTMDHVGPLTRSVGDAAILLQAIADMEDMDGHLDESISGKRIGVPRDFFFEGGSAEVRELIMEALRTFESLGAKVEDVSIPGIDKAFDAANTTFFEALENYEQLWKEHPGSFSDQLGRLIKKTGKRTAKEYEAAQQFRETFREQVAELMADYDVLVSPTSTVAASPLDEPLSVNGRERWKNTSIFNLTGQPSISVPCGFTGHGLPVGLMITGRVSEDATVLLFAQAFEKAGGWSHHHPPGF